MNLTKLIISGITCSAIASCSPADDNKVQLPKAPETQPAAQKDQNKNASAIAKDGDWYLSIAEAKAAASSDKKKLLLYFCISDLSEKSQNLEKYVFNSPAWKKFTTAYVPVKLDYPVNDEKLNDKLKRQNAALKENWRIKAMPILLVLNSSGEQELARIIPADTKSADKLILQINNELEGDKADDEKAKPLKEMTGGFEKIDEKTKVDIKKIEKGAEIGSWTEDLEAARKLAKESGKPLLLNFTGSDWCHACKMMESEVFSKATWGKQRNNYVLVTVDFPRQKELPEERKKRNEALADKFGITAFPTFVLLDDDGESLIGTVQSAMNPKDFIASLERVLKFRKSRILKTAAEMGNLGEDYKTTMLKLKEDIRKSRKLHNSLQEAYMNNNVDEKMIEESEKLEKDLETGYKKVRDLETKHYATKLPEAEAKKFSNLNDALNTAINEFEKWRQTNPVQNEASWQKYFEMMQMIRTLENKIADIKDNHELKGLPPASIAAFNEHKAKLRLLQTELQGWLQSDPENTEENINKHKKYESEINLLLEKMESIRNSKKKESTKE